MNEQADTISRRFFGFIVARAISLIVIGALLCTLLAKLYWAIHINRLNEWISWVESDIFVLAAVELLLVLMCFIWPKKAVARITTIAAALVCTWSVINAGWLIATGTQVLPAVLLPLFFDPLSRFRIVGHHLAMRPFAAIALLAPSAAALAFFFYILAKPVVPVITKKHIRNRIIVYAVLFVSAAVFGGGAKNNTGATAELRYNSQFKAIKSLFFRGGLGRNYAANSNVRKILLEEAAGTEQMPLLNKKSAGKFNAVIVVLEGISPPQTNLFNKGSANVPFLKSLAKKGIAFTNCHTIATHTTKALFAIHTGRYASVSQDYVEAAVKNKSYQSIATILKNRGYRTAFFQSAAGTFEARPGLVHNLGFDYFFAREDIADANTYLGYLAADEFALIEPVCKWIEQSEEPFLITILGSAVHDPYEIPKWFASGKTARLSEPEQRYRMLIEYTDSFLAKLYERICQTTKRENLIFCVIGDHGEAFGQHGRYGHARIPYDEAIKVFWLIKSPGIVWKHKINSAVSNLDVTPTLLKILGFDTSKGTFDGVNALRKSSPDRKVYFSTWMNNGPAGFIARQQKFIYDPTNEMVIKFDLSKDPDESKGTFILKKNSKDQTPIISEVLKWQREMFIDLRPNGIEKYQRIFNNWLCQTNKREPRAVYDRR